MRSYLSFRDGPQGRTRNPDADTEFLTGFRTRRFTAFRDDDSKE